MLMMVTAVRSEKKNCKVSLHRVGSKTTFEVGSIICSYDTLYTERIEQ
jgi:hypothetical protein